MPVITRLPPAYEEAEIEAGKTERERGRKAMRGKKENAIRYADWSESEHRSFLIRRDNAPAFFHH